jgi:hypothetical protein
MSNEIMREAEARGCSSYLLLPVRDIAMALAEYMRGCRDNQEGWRRNAIAFRLYHSMSNARQLVCLASL